MGKKLIALLLVLVMLLSICSVTAFAAPCNANSSICDVEADLFGGILMLHQIAKLLVDRAVDAMHLMKSSLLCPIEDVQTAAKTGAKLLKAVIVGHVICRLFKGCQPASPTDPEPIKYTVTFDLNDVEINGTAPATQTVICRGKIEKKPASPTALDPDLTFAGWYRMASPSELDEPWDFDKDVVTSDMVLYAKWQESENCIAAGTMITMGDGEQKAVENLEIGDVIRTFDHETGKVSSAPVCFIWESKNVANAFTLTFEDDIAVTVVEEHGFYDQEEQKYAFINANNAKDYIGHHFYDADNNSWIELLDCEVLNDSVDAYAIITSGDLNHLSNGILSICDGTVKMLANVFEYDGQMKFDEGKKRADIEKYGLMSKEKILELEGFTESDYDDYNLQYLNVAIGKGLTSWERLEAFSDYCIANGI